MGWTHIRDLYDAYRFRDAYEETESWWSGNTLPPNLGTPDLVLAGRLAERLGGIRLARQLGKLAHDRDPTHPHVMLYVRCRMDRATSLYTMLLDYETFPELPGAKDDVQMHWMAAHVYLLTSVRDFRSAERGLAQVKERFGEDDWLTLMAAELEYAKDRWKAAEALALQVFERCPMMYHNLSLLSRIAARRHAIPTLLQRFESIRADVQNYQVAILHVWYLIAHAQRHTGAARDEALATASLITERYDNMVPLADRRTRERLALSRLDLASEQGDRPTTWREANRLRSRWHQRLATNLRKRPDGKRRVVPHHPVWQGKNTCLPCSVCTLHPRVDLQKLVRELTYGGTSVVRCIEWMEREAGLHAVPFVATSATIRKISKAGIGFVYLTGGDNWAHAMAAIGIDEAADTLLIHDPSSIRVAEVLLEDIKLYEGPFGPQCIALVPEDRVSDLTATVPEQDRLPFRAYLDFIEHLRVGDVDGAAATLRALVRRFPDHPFTLRMEAVQNALTSRLPDAVETLESLLSEHPANLHIRLDLITALHRARNTRRQTEVYHDLMRRGTWGTYEATRSRRDPVYVARYADMLGLTRAGLAKAAGLLRITLRRAPYEAELWHNLGDVLWRQGDLNAAWIPLRTASHLAGENEHYARSLVDVGCNIGRLEEAIEHLEHRARLAGTAAGAGAPWVTWVGALADFGFPKKAQDTLAEALRSLPEDADLLAFALQFQADNGFPDEAHALLPRVRALADIDKARRAEALYLQSVGRPHDALELLEERLAQHPSDVSLAGQVAHLLAGCHGTEAVLTRVREWAEHRPNDEGFEDLLYRVLTDQHHTEEAEALMRRRLERNPQDAWAWIQWGHAQVRRAELARAAEREHVLAACEEALKTALSLSLPDANRLMLEARYARAKGDRGKAWDLYLDAMRLEADPYDALRFATNLLRERTREDRLEPMRELLQLLRDRGTESDAIPEFLQCWADTLGMQDALNQIRAWRADRPTSQLLARAEIRLLLDGQQGRKAAAEALDLLNELTERFPQTFSLSVWRAEALRGLNDLAGMRKAYEDLLKRFPLHLHSRDQLASAMVRDGDIDGAIALLRKGVGLQPQDRDSWNLLATLYDNLGRKEDAVEVLSDAVTRMPRDIGLNRDLVDLLVDLDRDAEAVDHARALVQRFESGSYLWYILGMTLERTGVAGSQGEIENAYRTALTHNSGLYEAADDLARFLTLNGRPDDASAVLDVFPDAEEYAAPIGGRRIWVQAQTGDMDDARRNMHALLKIHPDYLWGWYQLLAWLEEDNDAARAFSVLSEIPEELRHHVDWRVRRVQVLENCGVKEDALEQEWEELVAEYPTNADVVLTYVDRCMERERWDAAKEWLAAYATLVPNSPVVQARLVKIHIHQERRSEAVDLAFEIWSRPGWDVEWADHTAWWAVASVDERQRVWREFIRHLKEHRHLRPWLVTTIVRTSPRLSKLRLESLVRKHPESNHLLPGLLDGYYELGRMARANRIWNRIPEPIRSEPALWSVGIRIANVDSTDRSAVHRVRERLQDWRERDDVGMWVLTNVIHVHTRNLDLLHARETGFQGEDREWLETVIQVAEHAMRRLQFDYSVQFVALSWVQSLLALGYTENAVTVYREFEYVCTAPHDDFWSEPITQALGQDLANLVPHLEETPLSLRRIASALIAASATENAPIAVYSACVFELRRRPDVTDRDASFCVPPPLKRA